MNINELQQIGEIISSMGDQATTGFLYYLIASYTMQLLWASIFIGVLVVIYKLVDRLMEQSVIERFFRRIREILGIGSVGCLTGKEMRDIQNKIEKLVLLQNKKNS